MGRGGGYSCTRGRDKPGSKALEGRRQREWEAGPTSRAAAASDGTGTLHGGLRAEGRE